MRGTPTFQPYAPWLITMGRSAFFGSRAVHMVSASMSNVSRTGNPWAVSGMAILQESGRTGSARHRARAGTLALEPFGEREDSAVGVPGTDDLQADRHAVRRPPARQRDRRMAGQVERPRVRIPGAADRSGHLVADRDRRMRIVIERERGAGERR